MSLTTRAPGVACPRTETGVSLIVAPCAGASILNDAPPVTWLVPLPTVPGAAGGWLHAPMSMAVNRRAGIRRNAATDSTKEVLLLGRNFAMRSRDGG